MQTIQTRVGNARIFLVANAYRANWGEGELVKGTTKYWVDYPGTPDLRGKYGSLSAAIGDAVLINSIRTIGAESC